MRTLYKHPQHRLVRLLGLAVVAAFFIAFVVGSAIGLVVSLSQLGAMSVFLAAMVAAGCWGLFRTLRYYLSAPREVNLLDNGHLQFLRRGRSETVSPAEFTAIRFVREDEADDYLRV